MAQNKIFNRVDFGGVLQKMNDLSSISPSEQAKASRQSRQQQDRSIFGGDRNSLFGNNTPAQHKTQGNGVMSTDFTFGGQQEKPYAHANPVDQYGAPRTPDENVYNKGTASIFKYNDLDNFSTKEGFSVDNDFDGAFNSEDNSSMLGALEGEINYLTSNSKDGQKGQHQIFGVASRDDKEIYDKIKPLYDAGDKDGARKLAYDSLKKIAEDELGSFKGLDPKMESLLTTTHHHIGLPNMRKLYRKIGGNELTGNTSEWTPKIIEKLKAMPPEEAAKLWYNARNQVTDTQQEGEYWKPKFQKRFEKESTGLMRTLQNLKSN